MASIVPNPQTFVGVTYLVPRVDDGYSPCGLTPPTTVAPSISPTNFAYNKIPGFDFYHNDIDRSSDPKLKCDLDSTCIGYNVLGFYKNDFMNPIIVGYNILRSCCTREYEFHSVTRMG